MNNFRKPSRTLMGRFVWFFIRPAMMANLDLFFMGRETLKQHIIARLLEPIRYSRDQRGDDRCWFDDLVLYWNLPESVRYSVKLSVEAMADRCAHFYQCRTNQVRPPVQDAGAGLLEPNSYLDTRSWWQLVEEACRLRAGVRTHRDKGMSNRTVRDDEELYALLPEGEEVRADFRVPQALLANCRRICSHVDPEDVDLSQWPEGVLNPWADWRPDEPATD
jgi:hypothetical protein